ncbi:MAG: hypothetical protein DCC45_01695 [Armatimonadetes bacterium]|nr:MAG: hypothetical protein DCC45_01695 [Armatimonadota bacterium]
MEWPTGGLIEMKRTSGFLALATAIAFGLSATSFGGILDKSPETNAKQGPEKGPGKGSGGDGSPKQGDQGPKPGTGPKPGGDQGPKPGTGPKPGGDQGPKPGTGPKPGGDQGPKPGTGPKPGGDGGPKPSTGPKPGGDGGPKPSTGPKPGGDKGPKPSTGPKPYGGSSGPSYGAGPGSAYKQQGRDYLSRTPSMDDYFRVQRRTDKGPIFNPRSGPGRTEANNNLLRKGASPDIVVGTNVIPRQQDTRSTRTSDDRGSIGFQVTRMEDYRVGELRRGYVHYDPYWSDCHFGYGFYFFDPVPWQTCFSPYYWYWCVPGYISYRRVSYSSPRIIIVIGDPIRWSYCGIGWQTSYYGGYYYNDRGFSSMDRALSDLVDAFLYSEPRKLDYFLPRRGSVDIYIEGRYSYTLSSDDYYDMTADLITSVYTTNFDFVDVRRTKGREVRAVARHDFIDAWNRRQTVWMTFTFDQINGQFVIVEAGTSSYRPYLD